MLKSLQNASKIYNPVPTRIFFFYNCEYWKWKNVVIMHTITLGYQASYTELKKQLTLEGIKCDFIKGEVVTEADLDALADPEGGQTLIIVDDNSISAASSKEMAHIFTVARHKNCSIVLLLHFIFGPWPSSRIISANTAYFFLLKSPRMAQQIATLGSQVGKQRSLVSAYEREARKTYGYVLVDLCTQTPEHLRIRTNVFAELLEPPIEDTLSTTITAYEPPLKVMKTMVQANETDGPAKETIDLTTKTMGRAKKTIGRANKMTLPSKIRPKMVAQPKKKSPNEMKTPKNSTELNNDESDHESDSNDESDSSDESSDSESTESETSDDDQ